MHTGEKKLKREREGFLAELLRVIMIEKLMRFKHRPFKMGWGGTTQTKKLAYLRDSDGRVCIVVLYVFST